MPGPIDNAVLSNDQRYVAFMSWQEKPQKLYVYDLSEDSATLIVNKHFSYEIPQIRLNIQFNTNPRSSLKFSPDSKTIVVSMPYEKDTEKGVRLIFFDLDNPDQELIFETPVVPLVNPAIEIGGKTYLHSDGYRYGWLGWQQTVSTSAVAMSPDKLLVAIGTDDGQLIIFNSQTGEVIEQRQAHVENIIGVSFAEDGRLLASLSRSGILKLWGILQ